MPGIIWRASPSVKLARLMEEPFILVDYSHTRDYLLSVFAECGLPVPRICQRVRSYELVRTLVGIGFGFSIVNISPAFGCDPSVPVVARPILDQVRVPRLVIARMQRARLNHIQTEFMTMSSEIVRGLPLMDRAR